MYVSLCFVDGQLKMLIPFNKTSTKKSTHPGHENVNDINLGEKSFSLIALNFPVFSDGRSYTNARELRQQLNYEGEIRAIGDVLRDQLFYMLRCGFNAFEIRHDQDPDLCLAAFNDFQTGYQASIDEPDPLFRRR